MKDDILKYGIVHGCRYYRSQKKHFLDELSVEVKPLALDVQLIKTNKRFVNTTHLLVNDPEKADVLMVVGYDTLSKLVPRAPYYPFNAKKNAGNESKNIALQSLLFLLVLSLDYLLLLNFASFSFAYKGICCLAFILSALLCFFQLFGFPNRLNYNRSSVGVVLALSLIKKLGKRSNVAFAFLDQATGSFQGYKELGEYLSGHNCSIKNSILLDAIADGSILAFAGARQQEKAIDALTTSMGDFHTHAKLYDKLAGNPRLTLLDGCIIISGGEQLDCDLIVKASRSRHDYKVNLPRLERLRDVLADFISADTNALVI